MQVDGVVPYRVTCDQCGGRGIGYALVCEPFKNHGYLAVGWLGWSVDDSNKVTCSACKEGRNATLLEQANDPRVAAAICADQDRLAAFLDEHLGEVDHDRVVDEAIEEIGRLRRELDAQEKAAREVRQNWQGEVADHVEEIARLEARLARASGYNGELRALQERTIAQAAKNLSVAIKRGNELQAATGRIIELENENAGLKEQLLRAETEADRA